MQRLREAVGGAELRRTAVRAGYASAMLLALPGFYACSFFAPSVSDYARLEGQGAASGGRGGASQSQGGGADTMRPPDDGGGGSVPISDGGTSNAGGTVTGGGAQDVGGGGDAAIPNAGQSSGGAAGDAGETASLGGTPANGGSAGNGSAGALHELAFGKKATASSQEVGNEAAHGNDNNPTTRWCAIDGAFPQWWLVDLGASHALTQISIKFEHTDRHYYYVVETSPDSLVYTQQIMANGTGVAQTLDLPANVSARYVRVTITTTSPLVVNGNGTWASFWEFSLFGY